MSGKRGLLPGEFGAATGLSSKALRLYAELGLLAPARTDPGSGYRRYDRSQIPFGRMIARLRALGLPLARIGVLVQLDPAARQAALRAWVSDQEAVLRRRHALVDALEVGAHRVAWTPFLRARPERKLLYREGRVLIGELGGFVERAQACLRGHLRACGLSSDGEVLVAFRGFVTEDSDGPIEVAVPFTGSVDPVADLRVRLSPPGTDLVLPLSEGEAGFPGILGAYDAVEAWMDAHGLVQVAEPVESRPGSDGAFLDISYPVVLQETL